MKKNKEIGTFYTEGILLQSSNESRALLNKGFGFNDGEMIGLSPYEVVYLLEKDLISLKDQKGKEIKKISLISRIRRNNARFLTKYAVYKDLVEKDYTVKTGAKYGATFRVYPKNTKQGQAHSSWLVIVKKESDKMEWEDFLAKNRVANSTKKNTLLALVDHDNSCTYFEVSWKKL